MWRRVVSAVWFEVAWWLRLVAVVVRRFPGQAAIAVGVGWLVVWRLPTLVTVAAVVLVVGLRGWAVAWPVGFDRMLGGPVVRVWRRWWIRRHWATVAAGCGLGADDIAAHQRHGGREPQRGRSQAARTVASGAVPRLVRTGADGARVRLRVRPLLGQTVEDFEQAGERLRTAVAATRVRVEPHGANEALVTFTMGDPLAAPFHTDRPHPGSAVVTDRVPLGRLEDGSTWRLPVGPHTLVAGCSGAGKGSVFWSFAFGLVPAARAGLVRLYGIDLKGGMEILMGKDLFSRRATNAAEAVAVLESLVEQMHARTHQYAGRVRSHTATDAEPLHVVMIDELAALTAYCPDRSLQRRAELAINLLCSQGRAPGFMVFACLQDPRKEVIPARGLFTQMIGLRLKDVNETAMVLGETAVASGAHCHRITRSTPGMGYVVPEDGGSPIRVRAGMTPDHAIGEVAAQFGTTTDRTESSREVYGVDDAPSAGAA